VAFNKKEKEHHNVWTSIVIEKHYTDTVMQRKMAFFIHASYGEEIIKSMG
jgi:hypothetical protein